MEGELSSCHEKPKERLTSSKTYTFVNMSLIIWFLKQISFFYPYLIMPLKMFKINWNIKLSCTRYEKFAFKKLYQIKKINIKYTFNLILHFYFNDWRTGNTSCTHWQTYAFICVLIPYHNDVRHWKQSKSINSIFVEWNHLCFAFIRNKLTSYYTIFLKMAYYFLIENMYWKATLIRTKIVS